MDVGRQQRVQGWLMSGIACILMDGRVLEARECGEVVKENDEEDSPF